VVSPRTSESCREDDGFGLGSVRVRIGVLASGSGTILQSIIDAGIDVECVVADRPCGATARVAADAGIVAYELRRSGYGPDFDRDRFSAQLADRLVSAGIDLVVMAGFGTILSRPMFDAYPHRILNTHPALLPAFPGWHGVEDALAYGVKVTGCTIHVATLTVDAGPILAQEAVPVMADDDAASLHERIKAVERRLYPETIERVLDQPDLLDPS